ncbi:unnamed protein product [Effrenium voratum]|uniref:FAD/NAD(P)-binding domain-containing protein n=1 Tax=Effrenium voratum TaxID=2562239 RepID=A0AA36J2F1_9DINO|nr:unnamed protein product [Effrenium voratum]
MQLEVFQEAAVARGGGARARELPRAGESGALRAWAPPSRGRGGSRGATDVTLIALATARTATEAAAAAVEASLADDFSSSAQDDGPEQLLRSQGAAAAFAITVQLAKSATPLSAVCQCLGRLQAARRSRSRGGSVAPSAARKAWRASAPGRAAAGGRLAQLIRKFSAPLKQACAATYEQADARAPPSPRRVGPALAVAQPVAGDGSCFFRAARQTEEGKGDHLRGGSCGKSLAPDEAAAACWHHETQKLGCLLPNRRLLNLFFTVAEEKASLRVLTWKNLLAETRRLLAGTRPGKNLALGCPDSAPIQQFDYVIVGGGTAAGYACRELAAQGSTVGKVAVAPRRLAEVTAEPVAPYERPALTKAYLHPPTAKVRARLPGFHTCVGGGGERQTPEWYAEKGISFIQGKATSLDLESKAVSVGEEKIQFGKLILATGCRPVRLGAFGVKGDDLANVCYLREEKDAAELVATLEKGKTKAVVVGGGYLGLECAAALLGWGVETTVVFPETHVFARLFGPELGAWLEEQFIARGAKLIKGDTVTEFTGEGALAGAQLKSGASLPCDVAVVGVGGQPNVEFCEGLKMENKGILVDANMQTSHPDVFACGDIATYPSRYGGTTRSENVDHARKSAAQAVKAAMGLKPEPYSYLPYFYTRIFEYTDAPIVFNFFGDLPSPAWLGELGSGKVG